MYRAPRTPKHDQGGFYEEREEEGDWGGGRREGIVGEKRGREKERQGAQGGKKCL